MVMNWFILATLTTKLNIDKSIAGNISECLAIDGNGDILANVLGADVYKTI